MSALPSDSILELDRSLRNEVNLVAVKYALFVLMYTNFIGKISENEIMQEIGLSPEQIRRTLKILKEGEFVSEKEGQLELTAKGRRILIETGIYKKYAVKVIPQESEPSGRRLPLPSLRVWIGFLLVMLGITEITVALWLVNDWRARLVLISMFVMTVLIYVVLLILWRFLVRPGAGRVAIITRRTQPRLVYPQETSLRIPLVETLYDEVPVLPMRYDCRVEFREEESSALPDIYQDICVQYQVALGEPTDPELPLYRGALNQLALLDRSNSRHPMIDYWNRQIGDGLRRYFENLSPDDVILRITDPKTNVLESQIKATLQELARHEGWGININDVHLRHYQIRKTSQK